MVKGGITDTGYWMPDTGCRILDAGCWMLDTGCWILDAGWWILDTLPLQVEAIYGRMSPAGGPAGGGWGWIVE